MMSNEEAQQYITEELSDIVYNEDFWSDLGFAERIIEPLTSAITRLEGDDSISNVFHEWRKLEEHYSLLKLSKKKKKLKEYITDRLNERWNLISDDIHPAAFGLDHRFREQSVDEEDLNDAERFYQNKCTNWNEFRKNFYSFRNFDPPFRKDPESDGVLYWKRLSNISGLKNTAALAIDTLEFPQTSAAVERIISALRLIQTHLRSALHRDTLGKDLFVYVKLSIE